MLPGPALLRPQLCCMVDTILSYVAPQGQVLFLGSDAPLAAALSASQALGSSVVAVHLTGDDLCSRVRVGDRALVTGCGRYYGGSGGGLQGSHTQLPCTLGVQVRGPGALLCARQTSACLVAT